MCVFRSGPPGRATGALYTSETCVSLLLSEYSGASSGTAEYSSYSSLSTCLQIMSLQNTEAKVSQCPVIWIPYYVFSFWPANGSCYSNLWEEELITWIQPLVRKVKWLVLDMGCGSVYCWNRLPGESTSDSNDIQTMYVIWVFIE